MRTIAIGLLVLAFGATGAGAQTADEKARILREFECRVANYTQQPRIFTPPVAVVFRQMIAKARAEGRELEDALPPLPAPLEYKLTGHDLVIRDKEADIVVGTLREAVRMSSLAMR